MTVKLAHIQLAGRQAGRAIRAVDTLTSATTAPLIAAPGTGMMVAVVGLRLANSGSTNNVLVSIQSAGNVIDYIYLPTETSAIVCYGFDSPLFCNANEALQWTTGAASTTMHISVHGFLSEPVDIVSA